MDWCCELLMPSKFFRLQDAASARAATLRRFFTEIDLGAPSNRMSQIMVTLSDQAGPSDSCKDPNESS